MKITLLSLAQLVCHVLLLTRVNSTPSLGSLVPPSPMVISLPDLGTLLRGLDQWRHYIEKIINNTRKATIFIPMGNVQTNTSLLMLDPSEVFYHVVPCAFSFFQLKMFENGTRFPTLVENKSILVTYNNESNFTIDNIPITLPDMFSNGIIAIHGLPTFLNYKVYGGNANVPLPLFPSPPSSPPPLPPPPPPSIPPPSSPRSLPPPPQHSLQLHSSTAPQLASNFPVTILAIFIVMGFQILS